MQAPKMLGKHLSAMFASFIPLQNYLSNNRIKDSEMENTNFNNHKHSKNIWKHFGTS